MILTQEQQRAVEEYDTGPWAVEEMDLLADEAEEMIARKELDGH
jgi:hypothetical protein